MTYALTRDKSYQEYLDDESLSPDGNYRFLSTGVLIEVTSEADINLMIAHVLGKVNRRQFKKRMDNTSRRVCF